MNFQFSIQLVVFAIVFLVVIPASAQSTFCGFVFDQTGENPNPMVSVKIKGTDHFTITDESGWFWIDSIPEGNYNVFLFSNFYGFDTMTINVNINGSGEHCEEFTLNNCVYKYTSASKKCPECGKKNKVKPILYGLVIGEFDEKKYYYAGCEISNCDPQWYCERDGRKF